MQALNNAGLGLGLPSAFAYTSEVNRACSSKTVRAVSDRNNIDSEYLFPLPTKGRVVSAETIRVHDFVSYWSPATDIESEVYDEDYEEDLMESSPESLALQTPIEQASSPLQLAAHACLHLLSPKLEMLASSAAKQGLSASEVISEALDFAWLVPMVDIASKAAAPIIEAPQMVHRPSLSSLASSISLASPSECSSSVADAAMARSFSVLSTFSSDSLSTTATSFASTSSSVLDRKRPITGRLPSNSPSKVIKLRGSRSRINLREQVKSVESTPMKPVLSSRCSISSQSASIFSPSASEMDMMFQPMDSLPSPCASPAERLGKNSPSSISASHLVRADTRNALLDIWSAAEDADLERRSAAKLVSKSASTADFRSSASEKVQHWMKKVKKSASSTNLRKHASEARIEDVEAWASNGAQQPTSFENCFEPRPVRAEIRKKQSIEQIIRPAVEQKELPALSISKGKIQDPVWSFLG